MRTAVQVVQAMTSSSDDSIYSTVPDVDGHFGVYGGKYVAETLMSALRELEELYDRLSHDEAFQRAVANGVRAHHWPFGSMPPVEGLTRGDVQMIVAYVREMQRANGIA